MKEDKELSKQISDLISYQKNRDVKESKAEALRDFAAKFNVIAGAFYMLTTIFFFTHMMETNEWKANVNKTLQLDSTVSALIRKAESEQLKNEIRNQLDGYISLPCYFEIEGQRAETVVSLVIELGRKVNVREEELEILRTTYISKLNGEIRLGTIRGEKDR